MMLNNDLMKTIRHIEIRTKKLVNDSYAGEYHSVFKGRGMEFDEVRPYHVGDEVRTIDWNVSARTGELHVKRYVEERELTLMLLVDASASNDFGSSQRFKREVAAEIAAVLSFAASNNNDKIGLLLFTDQIEMYVPPRKGRKHILRLIRELLTFQPQGRGTDLKMALDTVNRILKRRSVIFLLSDFLVDPSSYGHELAITNRRHDLVALELHDRMEREFTDLGLVSLEDPETGVIELVDTSSRDWQRGYSDHMATLDANKRRTLMQASVDHIRIRTDEDYTIPLTNFFQDRAKRMRR
jgi:uncharacterized protein (DUF58 family)